MPPRLILAVLLFAVACGSRRAAPAPPSNPATAPAADAATAKPFTCGAASCGAGEMCEDRFKGHDIDDQGRPLERKKCMPLPDACRAEPTCDCVVHHVSATHCADDGAQVRIDDYPR